MATKRIRPNNNEENMVCGFCNRERISSPGVLFYKSDDRKTCICEVCVETLNELGVNTRMSGVLGPEYQTKTTTKKTNDVVIKEDFTPENIHRKLDEYVIGQERAKKVLSIAAYNHYMRCSHPEMELEKENILLVGPTGSGKTYLVETLAKILDVPFTTVDITAYSETGYKGKDPAEIIQQLVKIADGNITKAEHGIVFIDEIDKTAGSGGSGVGDVKVQSSLLKMVDGIKQDFGMSEHGESVLVDTKNILFIFAGAFAGIEDVKQKRTGGMGFNSSTVGDLSEKLPLEARDLIVYGMLPELIGRMPIKVELSKLEKDDLVRILKETKNSKCKQYTRLLGAEGVNLVITDDAYDTIAETAIKSKLGARALQGIVEDTMEDILYFAPSLPKGKRKKKIVISNKDIKDGRGNYVKEAKSE